MQFSMLRIVFLMNFALVQFLASQCMDPSLFLLATATTDFLDVDAVID